MGLLTAGYFPDTYWPSDYYIDNYWPEYGTAVPDVTPYPLFINITQSLSAGVGLVPGVLLVPLGTLSPSGGIIIGSIGQEQEYNITMTQSGGGS